MEASARRHRTLSPQGYVKDEREDPQFSQKARREGKSRAIAERRADARRRNGRREEIEETPRLSQGGDEAAALGKTYLE